MQLGLIFPGTSTAASEASVDLALHSEEELLGVKDTPSGQQFPLIIRLETVTEQGLAEGHSLSVSSAAERTTAKIYAWHYKQACKSATLA